ncbi:hypothetical protein DP091_08135 [Paenibacillus sp. MDMC362]|nr:hypothetical protein DP091_08135 [Paenibacillus sp. MDMC362]
MFIVQRLHVHSIVSMEIFQDETSSTPINGENKLVYIVNGRRYQLIYQIFRTERAVVFLRALI